MDYRLQTKPGNKLSKTEIEACVLLIKAGDAVDPGSAKRQMPHAAVVAMVREGEDIVAVGAVKQRRPTYARRISSAEKSGFAFDPQMHELGYVSVDKSRRGLGLSRRIVAGLTNGFDSSLYATTSHPGMKKVLKEAGFAAHGKEWENQKHESLSLWIRKSKQPITSSEKVR